MVVVDSVRYELGFLKEALFVNMFLCLDYKVPCVYGKVHNLVFSNGASKIIVEVLG